MTRQEWTPELLRIREEAAALAAMVEEDELERLAILRHLHTRTGDQRLAALARLAWIDGQQARIGHFLALLRKDRPELLLGILREDEPDTETFDQ